MTMQFSASIVCVVLLADTGPALALDFNLGGALTGIGPRYSRARRRGGLFPRPPALTAKFMPKRA